MGPIEVKTVDNVSLCFGEGEDPVSVVLMVGSAMAVEGDESNECSRRQSSGEENDGLRRIEVTEFTVGTNPVTDDQTRE